MSHVARIFSDVHNYNLKLSKKNPQSLLTFDCRSPSMDIPAITTRSTCRVCYSDKLTPVFSLGNLYVSNFIAKEDMHKQVKAPLDLIFCENCTLLQLKHTAPQELLYSGFYWYRSGVTETMKKALRDITTKIEKKAKLKEKDIVLDIGSNDGTLLRTYTIPNLVSVGVEPAKNLADEGKKGLSHFINDFWTIQNYNKAMNGKRAKVITAIGMFYDMEDPNQFIADIATALRDDGIFIAQLMCLKNMIDTNDVGNLCFKPDTIILGDNKIMSDVTKGNFAIGKNGTLVKVNSTMKRAYKGDMIRIKPKYLQEIVATPEHPILIVKKEFLRNECHQIRDKIGSYKPEWVNARDMRRGDWVVVPKLKHNKKISSLDLTKHNRIDSRGYRNGLLEFPLTEETAWLLGMYIAEGHIGGQKDNPYINFTLHTKEKSIRSRIDTIFSSLGYTISTVYPNNRKSMEVRVTCAALSRALTEWVGRGARNKMIPDFIMLAPQKIKKSFIQGLFEGDGYIKGKKIHYHTSSKVLALQVQLLVASFGGLLGISYVKPYKRIIRGKPVNSKDSWQLRGTSPELSNLFDLNHKTKKFRHVFPYHDYYLVPVKQVSKEYYDGVVCNIETSDHSYLVSNAVVHNCHEHLEFYSFASLEFLFNKHGLDIFDIEINDINGGSYRVYARRKDSSVKQSPAAAKRIAKVKESEKDLNKKEAFLEFYNRLEENKKRCVDFIAAEKAKGKRIWVYGASTKGNTILQYYGLTDSVIDAASERSPEKWGRYTVGTMIKCVSEEEARKANPDYFLVLPYAFFNEMYEREAEWRAKGGKFIVPLPKFRIVK